MKNGIMMSGDLAIKYFGDGIVCGGAKMKRWLQFGLRSLSLWMALIGLMLGWWLDHHNLARQAEDAENEAKRELRSRLIWEVRYKGLRVGLGQIGMNLRHQGVVLSDCSLLELQRSKQVVEEQLGKEGVDIGWMDDLRPTWNKPPKPSPRKPTPEEVKQRIELLQRLRDGGVFRPTTNPQDQP